ncbi:rhomboid family intramembrane serine protease [Alphaproteobacteria bacterium]|jgi:membrane associated rhomboid family serine protease|nr:rhomboid family intramembrane serine protease [Alphaproteobacteria bacterium]|tara:strand:+ start:1 stop:732 length:732 start_codon:yes stop_codon:yes gene_type:complete
MFPIKDDNPTESRPYVTCALIGLNILIFFYQIGLEENIRTSLIFEYGFKPSQLFSNANSMNLKQSSLLTIFTSMFLHGGLFHLLGNMLFLWIYGNNVEDSMGHIKFLIFYLLCGLAASLLQAIVSFDSSIPMIGASGAVSGVLSAYFLLYPKARVLTLVVLLIFITFIRIPAGLLIGFWFLSQIINAYFNDPNSPGVAWYAHIGGFLMGLLLIPFFKKKKFKFFSSGTNKKEISKRIRLKFRK